MATPAALARAELKEVRTLIRVARVALRGAHRKVRSSFGKEHRTLAKRQATLARRIKRLADEYKSNRRRLREMAPAWQAITGEIATLEREINALRERESRVKSHLAEVRNWKRSKAASRAGRASWERTAEWFDRYLYNAEGITTDNGASIPRAMAAAVAREHGWRSKLTPDRAAERLAEVIHDNPYIVIEWSSRPSLVKAREREVRHEELARALANVPF